MIANLITLAVSAVLKIAGCFAFWAWLRRGASPVLAVAGVASLIGFAIVWLIEGQRPTGADLLGAAVAVTGAVVIVAFGVRGR